MPYLFLDDHTYLFDCAVELIEADRASVVNVEEFETFSEVPFLGLWLRALLSDLCSQLSLKSSIMMVSP